MLIRKGEYRELCEFEHSYDYADDPLHVYHLRQATAFFSKRADLEIGIDKERAAWEKFEFSEEKCRETNTRLRQWARGDLFPPDVEQVIFLAQRKIAHMLGPVPGLSDLKLHFGPGATTKTRKRTAAPRYKLAAAFACSEDLLPSAQAVLEEVPAWAFGPDNPNVEAATVTVEINHGKLSFVPKNAKTLRSVVTEPPLNGFVQLAIGDYLKRRFKAFGLDLSSQERNQALARVGSITGALATLDLSSASDLISKEVVYHLLPLDWAAFLAQFRTGKVVYNGLEITLQKFSSMGNGYTFPLESLIFFGVASAATQVVNEQGDFSWKDQVGVYGDDIIVPTEAVDLTIRVLETLGFEINKTKSFWAGPFRESCGKDYFRGFDVRPVYIKDVLCGANAFTLHNFYVRSWQPEFASHVLDTMIAKPLRLWGPDGYGDGHLIGKDPSEFLRPHRRSIPKKKSISGGWGGFIFDTYTWNANLSFRPSPGDRVLPAYTIYANEPHVNVDLLEQGRAWLRYPYDFRPKDDQPVGYTYRKNKSGEEFLGVPTPGKRGYRRISIYTLNPNG